MEDTKKIVTFFVNGNKEVPGVLFGTNIENSLGELQKNLEIKLNQLRNDGYNIISVVSANVYEGGGNYSIRVIHQMMIIAEI